MTTTPTAPAPKATITFRKCGCGCGADVAGKTIFKQGHDARLVSLAAQTTVGYGPKGRTAGSSLPADHLLYADCVAEVDIQDRINTVAKLIELHWSTALATKYDNAAMNLWAAGISREERAATAQLARDIKAQAKQETFQYGTVKRGRWTYSAHRSNLTGQVRWEAKDGTVAVADDKLAATFTQPELMAASLAS